MPIYARNYYFGSISELSESIKDIYNFIGPIYDGNVRKPDIEISKFNGFFNCVYENYVGF